MLESKMYKIIIIILAGKCNVLSANYPLVDASPERGAVRVQGRGETRHGSPRRLGAGRTGARGVRSGAVCGIVGGGRGPPVRDAGAGCRASRSARRVGFTLQSLHDLDVGARHKAATAVELPLQERPVPNHTANGDDVAHLERQPVRVPRHVRLRRAYELLRRRGRRRRKLREVHVVHEPVVQSAQNVEGRRNGAGKEDADKPAAQPGAPRGALLEPGKRSEVVVQGDHAAPSRGG
mmetsp:Transcript_2269/g.6302  ORF Transcript_2269/g.6302 Transcript_2269/m.6302 type:complete len:236 (-) Transcript_2269:320-1027(-)